MEDRKRILKEISNNIENIIGKEAFENIKNAAKNNKLDSSRYYLLAEELKLMSRLYLTVALLSDIMVQDF